jgi:hypothetical protein
MRRYPAFIGSSRGHDARSNRTDSATLALHGEKIGAKFPRRANAGFTRTPRDGSRQRGQSPRPATSLIGLSSAQRGPEELHKPIHREALGVIFAQDQRTGDAQPVRFLL